MLQSTERQTAEAIVAAFNVMDIDRIISFRSPDCMRYIRPSTLGHQATNNEQYRRQLEQLKPIFSNFSLAIQDVVEDREARRICMWLKARADTLAGEYVNEYMWTLDFDETGTKVTKCNEFVDTVMNRDFWPKLREAMKAHHEAQAASSAS